MEENGIQYEQVVVKIKKKFIKVHAIFVFVVFLLSLCRT